MRQVILIGAVALGLSGCASVSNRAASIQGACSAFDAPTQPIVGANAYSKRWSAKTVEAGVSACGWPRPKRAEGTS